MPATTPRQVGRPGDQCGHGEGEHEGGLDEDRQRQVAARTLQREAVGGVPGGRTDREPGEGEESCERECVVADAQARRGRGGRDEQDRGAHRGGHEQRGEPVHERRALHVDAALAPEAAQLAVRLQRPGAPAPLEPRLGLLREPDEERESSDPADDLNGSGRDRLGAHPIAPIRTARSSATTSPIRYST